MSCCCSGMALFPIDSSSKLVSEVKKADATKNLSQQTLAVEDWTLTVQFLLWALLVADFLGVFWPAA